MKLRASVIARLVLIGFLAAVAWGLHQRAGGVFEGAENRAASYALTIPGGQ
jgi:hypothetical protein